MFFLRTFLPAAPVPAFASLLRRVLDVSLPEPARVQALRVLHGVAAGERAVVARALVPVLPEPLWWLPAEALAFMALAGGVLLGVRDGRLALCPSPRGLVGDGAGGLWCPELGRVRLPRAAGAFARDVSLPWLSLPVQERL